MMRFCGWYRWLVHDSIRDNATLSRDPSTAVPRRRPPPLPSPLHAYICNPIKIISEKDSREGGEMEAMFSDTFRSHSLSDTADRSDWIAIRTCPWCVCGNTHSGGKWNSRPVENKFYFVALRSDWGRAEGRCGLLRRGEGVWPRDAKGWSREKRRIGVVELPLDDGLREFPFFGETSWQLVWTPRPASALSSGSYFARRRHRSRNFSRFLGGVT